MRVCPVLRNLYEISRRQLQKFSVRTIAADDAENGPNRTMSRIAPQTFFAFTAAGVYLAHDALADDLRPIVRALDDADEFVPDRAFKPSIPAHDLEIGITNARPGNANKRFQRVVRYRNVVQSELSSNEPESFHRVRSPRW